MYFEKAGACDLTLEAVIDEADMRPILVDLGDRRSS